MKKVISLGVFKQFLTAFGVVAVSAFLSFAMAQSGGLAGLEKATTLVNEIFAWARTFVIAVASVYFLYLVLMAFLERKTWTDVLIGLGWCTLAGCAAALAEWAVKYWA